MIYIFNAQMKYNFRKNLRDMFLEWKSMNEWSEIVQSKHIRPISFACLISSRFIRDDIMTMPYPLAAPRGRCSGLADSK